MGRPTKAEQLRREAVNYLEENGKVAGVDFDPDHAVYRADELALELLLQKQIERDVYLDFDGDNCDECMGWDGEDRRCECGNRRVTFVEDEGHSFKTPKGHAEAW